MARVCVRERAERSNGERSAFVCFVSVNTAVKVYAVCWLVEASGCVCWGARTKEAGLQPVNGCVCVIWTHWASPLNENVGPVFATTTLQRI